MDNAKLVLEALLNWWNSNSFSLNNVVIDLIYNHKDINVGSKSYILVYESGENIRFMGIGAESAYSEADVRIDLRSSDYNVYIDLKSKIFQFIDWFGKNFGSLETDAGWKIVGVKFGNVSELSDKLRKMERMVVDLSLMKIRGGD